jgi:hypothetical protein
MKAAQDMSRDGFGGVPRSENLRVDPAVERLPGVFPVEPSLKRRRKELWVAEITELID